VLIKQYKKDQAQAKECNANGGKVIMVDGFRELKAMMPQLNTKETGPASPG